MATQSRCHRNPFGLFLSESKSTALDHNAFVVRHKGRLVLDDTNVGRFASSTTGVHLVLSVQDTCRTKMSILELFREICYRSYPLQPGQDARILDRPKMNIFLLTGQDAQNALRLTLEDAACHLRLFRKYWPTYCPSLLRKETTRRARHPLVDLNDTAF